MNATLPSPEPSKHRMMACSAASVGLHAVAGVVIFLGVGMATDTPAQPDAQMVVELAPLPSAPPVPPSLTPPQPDQTKAQPTPTPPVKQVVVPVLNVALDTPPAVVVPRPDPRPQPDVRKDRPAEETTRAAAPDAARRDEARAATVGAPSNSPSNAAQTWESRLLAVLERNKRYPGEAQRQGQQDVVYVRMRIDANGRLVDSQIRRSRGFSLLDGEVMSLVRRASPFPAPPAEAMNGQPTVTLTVPVEFFIDRPSRRGRGR